MSGAVRTHDLLSLSLVSRVLRLCLPPVIVARAQRLAIFCKVVSATLGEQLGPIEWRW